MFDKKFIYLSLQIRYENEQQKPYNPIWCEHYNALGDRACIRIVIHHLLQAIRSLRLPAHGARIVRFQCDNTVLHSIGVGIHYKGLAVSYREIP